MMTLIRGKEQVETGPHQINVCGVTDTFFGLQTAKQTSTTDYSLHKLPRLKIKIKNNDNNNGRAAETCAYLFYLFVQIFPNPLLLSATYGWNGSLQLDIHPL